MLLDQLPLYLDYQATTPLDPEALEAMMPYLTHKFGNPHSASHKFGWEGEAAIEVAREQIAKPMGAKPREIIFTSGATEANNLAVKGVMQRLKATKPRLVTVNTEHKCLLESAAFCARHGCELLVLEVEPDGLIDLNKLADLVDERTALVSVMAVNNEIGVIQPLKEISAIAHEKGALIHSDAAQAYGKIAFDVEALGLDLVSLSAHKTYGPKGVGALYRRAERRVMLAPQMSGGGQESGWRSGTLSPALIAGFGKAAEIATQKQAAEEKRLKVMMARFKARIFENIEDVTLNGHETQRFAGNLNLSFGGLHADLFLAGLRDLALSSGSACSSALAGGSYVLEAIGRGNCASQTHLRIGIGRFTDDKSLDFAAETLIKAAKEARL